MLRRLRNRFGFVEVLYHTGFTYPAPASLNYFWNFGSLALFVLVMQLVSGLLLSMHYVANVDFAFNSVEHIMRDVNYGWLLRYMHANGSSFFFLILYIHIFRGLFFGSYAAPRNHLWSSGVVLYILTAATAFLGYVLPWGQMSFWAATVITSLVGSVPVLGEEILRFIWGGFGVTTVTLNRFFSLHFLLPFVIAALAGIHLILLHEEGSSNPLGGFYFDTVSFYPYFIIKDVHGVVIFILFGSHFVLQLPDYAGHPDNYIPANPQVTPKHIVPEWYFLPFYAILRSVPNKLFGIVLMGCAMVILLVLPFYSNPVVGTGKFRVVYKIFFWIFVFNFFFLIKLGAAPIIAPYVVCSQICTIFYFLFFIFFIPVVEQLEEEYVLGKLGALHK